MPIFVIGGITLVVFIGIIIASQTKKPNGPILEKVNRDDLITKGTYTIGNDTAKVTLVEFSDFECPACGAAYPIVHSLTEQYKDSLKLAYKNFPLPQHGYARKAAEAARAAGTQGKFWEYADKLFTNQEKLDRANLIKYAQELNLDTQKFTQELDNGIHKPVVDEDLKLGQKLGINSTPTFFLNGERLVFGNFGDFERQIIEAINKQETPSSSESSNTN